MELKNMNWEVILWSCITVAVLVVLGAIVLSVLSARNMKKSRQGMADLQKAIKVGATVMFAGGIYGKIKKINDDLVDIEVSKGVVVQVSRYSIQSATK